MSVRNASELVIAAARFNAASRVSEVFLGVASASTLPTEASDSTETSSNTAAYVRSIESYKAL